MVIGGTLVWGRPHVRELASPDMSCTRLATMGAWRIVYTRER